MYGICSSLLIDVIAENSMYVHTTVCTIPIYCMYVLYERIIVLRISEPAPSGNFADT